MKAEILCVGTEILLGDIVNTNAAYIARGLADIGINVYYQSVVGDNNERLKEALHLAFSRADIVIMTGGLGPTYDDLTKETVAEYFGKKMVMDEEALYRITSFFDKYGRKMTENNKKQALMPEGATAFQNDFGTAPGLAISNDKKTAILLPGPPKEMVPMFDNSALPYLMRFSDHVLVSSNIKLYGIGESNVEDLLYDLMTKSKNPTIAPYAKPGEVTLRVTASAKSKEECRKMIEPVIEQIYSIMGEYIYGVDIESLQEALVIALKDKGLTIAIAESCTGGLVSQLVTQIPGSSEVFGCGVCAYSNEIKQKILGVDAETLAANGAVSAETAAEMAEGVRKIAGADIGISVTGVAGPDGGTEEKPVGTVYIAIDSDVVKDTKLLNLRWRDNAGQRTNIRSMAAQNVMALALRIIKKYR
ncbi:MAG: competence/damage-inducible protein A [Christensenellaceae bacterium]